MNMCFTQLQGMSRPVDTDDATVFNVTHKFTSVGAHARVICSDVLFLSGIDGVENTIVGIWWFPSFVAEPSVRCGVRICTRSY